MNHNISLQGTVVSVAATVATFLVSGTKAQAIQLTTIDYPLTFTTKNQSIWDTGSSSKTVSTDTLFSVPLNFSPSVKVGGCTRIIRICNEAKAGLNLRGNLSLQNTFTIDGGSIDASIPVNVNLAVPDASEVLIPGQTFTVKTGFSFGNNATFSTFSPNVSEKLQAILDLSAKIFGKVTIFNKNIINSERTIFNSSLTKDIINVGSQQPFPPINFPFGSISAEIPQVNTTGTKTSFNQLTSSGKDNFVEAGVDVPNLILSLAGLPPVLNGSLGPLQYSILSAFLKGDVDFRQNFSLIGQLPGKFLLENGTQIPFNFGQDVNITLPKDANHNLYNISALVDFDALFSNRTGLDFGLGLDTKVGQVKGPLGLSLGPVFRKDLKVAVSSVDVYKKSFKLGGFNSEKIAFQVRTGTVEAVPEPLTILSSSMALGFGVLFKKEYSRKKNKGKTLE